LNILRVLQSGSHDGDFDKLVQMGSNFCNDIRDKLWSKLVQQGQEGLEHERSDLLISHFRNPPGAPNAKSAQSIMQWPELKWFLIHPDPRRRSPDQQGQECMNSCKECMMNIVVLHISEQTINEQCSILGYLRSEWCQPIAPSVNDLFSSDATTGASTDSDISGQRTMSQSMVTSSSMG
jgi:hypothetical protein